MCLVNVKDPLILVNPKVTQVSKETVVYIEQCLSLDKTMAKPVRTLRHASITVECDNLGTVIFSPDKKVGEKWKDYLIKEKTGKKNEKISVNDLIVLDKNSFYHYVQDCLINNLPFPFINLFAFFIATLH